MTHATSLEELLRNTGVQSGSIMLLRIDGGGWRATVTHHNGHMVHPFDDWQADPVEALRIALLADEQRCRDLARRYAQAEKLGAVPPGVDDMEDLLG